MPKLTLYSFWIPSQNKPPTILIAGDREIHALFLSQFSDRTVQNRTWTASQRMYDYGFYVHDATEADRERFEMWLNSFQVIEPLQLGNDSLDDGYALSYHDVKTRQVAQLVRKAKPYGNESVTPQTHEGALALVAMVKNHLDCLPKADYFVSVPYLSKSFDLPEFMNKELCRQTGVANGSSFVFQIREKQFSQKDLDSVEEKRKNVDGLFGVRENHPFSGKVITIIDDIYRSGSTIDALAKVLRQAVVKRVQAFVLTKTFRD